MTVKSYTRGHAVETIDGIWCFSDTKEPCREEEKEFKRPCKHCGKSPTEDSHDACLGNLIGVRNACCGHGNHKEAYIQFLDKTCIYGYDAIRVLNVLKKYKKDLTDKDKV